MKEHGQKLLRGVAVLIVVGSALAALGPFVEAANSGRPGPSPIGTLAAFGASCVVAYYLTQGASWARWFMIAIFVLGALRGVVVGLVIVLATGSLDGFVILSLVMSTVAMWLAYLLLRHPAIRAFVKGQSSAHPDAQTDPQR